MITELTNGISKALYTATQTVTYAEFPRQDIIFPCFRILVENPTQENELGTRKRRRYDFDIQYFLDETGELDDEEGLRELADRMYDILEVIDLEDGKIRGRDLNWRITDGVLHFFVSYTVWLYKAKEKETYMKTLDANWEVKDGERNSSE